MREKNHKKFALIVLLLILASNYVDRSALGLLLQDIKVDLDLSDTELGFLSGIAFALFYSAMGIPLARWADRGNRIIIISITTALWSVAVALCGMAGNFVHLLLIRIGVAVGEAGCIPPAHSLIADYFSRAERPRAVAIYMLGWPLSVVIGYFLAGWLNELYGWRVTFILIGLPGLGLAALAWFTLKEPRLTRPREKVGWRSVSFTRARSRTAALPSAQPSLKEVCASLWGNMTFCHLLMYFAVANFFGFGVLQWQPAFFMRSHGLQTGELGAWFALIHGVGGIVGTYLGGELATRHAANNERLQLKIAALTFTAYAVVSSFIYLTPNPYLAFALMGLSAIGVYTINGPMFATIQTLVPERMRAMSIALIFLFSNLIGLGLGPLAAGALSDAFRTWAGEESLRYALLTLCPGYLWAAWHVWKGSKTVTDDIEVARRHEERQPDLRYEQVDRKGRSAW